MHIFRLRSPDRAACYRGSLFARTVCDYFDCFQDARLDGSAERNVFPRNDLIGGNY